MTEENKKGTKSIFNEISNNLKNRIKNPLIISFFIALVLYNWKAVAFFVFAKIEISQKIALTSSYSNVCTIFLFPFLTALVYALVIPYITAYIEKWLIKENDIRTENLSEIELNVHALKKERLEYEIELEKLEKQLREFDNISDLMNNHKLEIERKDEIINNLNQDIERLNKELKEKNSTHNKKFVMQGNDGNEFELINVDGHLYSRDPQNPTILTQIQFDEPQDDSYVAF